MIDLHLLKTPRVVGYDPPKLIGRLHGGGDVYMGGGWRTLVLPRLRIYAGVDWSRGVPCYAPEMAVAGRGPLRRSIVVAWGLHDTYAGREGGHLHRHAIELDFAWRPFLRTRYRPTTASAWTGLTWEPAGLAWPVRLSWR